MSPSKLVCLKLFIPMALSLVIPLGIPEVLCLSMWSTPHGLWLNVEKSIQPLFYILFLGHLNAFSFILSSADFFFKNTLF